MTFRSDRPGAALPWVGSAWSRRDWLAAHAAGVLGAAAPRRAAGAVAARCAARYAAQARPLEPGPAEALVLRAVDAAKAAGAQFATARLTRTVSHVHGIGTTDGVLERDMEFQGLGVQALVGGCWGFASSPDATPEMAARLGRAAAAQAKAMAARAPRGLPPVDLGRVPVVTGRWATPVQIDPFTIPVEEKQDHTDYWLHCLGRYGLMLGNGVCFLRFARQERVVATSEGSLFTQTTYESGGYLKLKHTSFKAELPVPGLADAAKGWELVLEARVPERLPEMVEALREEARLLAGMRSASVGRYTLVCDGATMAALVDATFGVATQLDRALGYEANAGGTSYLNDPLGMLGQLEVASKAVTLTANRSAPAQLATVKWDDEGVVPEDFTLVKDGVLVDYQTTREQAGWLTEYYAKQGKPVKSHGCAAAESALAVTLQHPPNLALEPGTATLDELVASVGDGILVTGGEATSDFQARTGGMAGTLRRIKNGKLGPRLQVGTVVLFNTPDLWKNVLAVGTAATRAAVSFTQYGESVSAGGLGFVTARVKGEPPQRTSRTASAPAAVIKDQALLNPASRA